MTVFRKYLRVDFLFAITGLIVLLAGCLFFDSNFDISIHDTTFSTTHAHISILLFTLFLLFALIYSRIIKAQRRLVKGLNVIHYFLTILPCLAFISIRFIEVNLNRYIASEHMSEEMDNMAKLYIVFSMSVLLCLLGQILFIVNIAISLIRKKTR